MQFTNIISRPSFQVVISLLLISFLSLEAIANNPGAETIPKAPNNFFVENKGQWEDEISFIAELEENRLFLMDGKLTYQLIDPEDVAERSHNHIHGAESHDHEPTVIHGHNFTVDFLGANDDVNISSSDKLVSYYNFILGDDPSKWADKVGLFRNVTYNNIYDDIDLKFYFSGQNIKYDYFVAPNANPSDIKMEYGYANQVFLNEGKLHIVTSVNEVIEQAPYAFQWIGKRKVEVPCEFILEDNVMSFHFPDGYDSNYELVIDPELIFASYSAASSDNWGMTATFDEAGNLYGGGLAWGFYPTTPGAFDTEDPNPSDIGNIGVSKFSPDGRQLIYSTYIGGSDMEVPHSMIVNSRGELVILGTTASRNFPTTVNAQQRVFGGGLPIRTTTGLTFNNGSDIVVVVLNDDGSNLTGSTYMGGSDNDGLHLEAVGVRLNYSDEIRGEVVLDTDDNIYVTSTTRSRDFPVSANAFDQTNETGSNGSIEEDAVVFKLTSNVNDVVWSTYLGGNSTDAGYSLKLDSDNNAYVVGITASNNFTTTPGALYPAFRNAGGEGFVTKIRQDGQVIMNSTFLNNSDFAYFVELDQSGFIYVVGQSSSRNYPITPGTYSNPNSTMFLQKLNPQLSESEFSTLLGNGQLSGIFVPSAFLVDVCDRIYISGWGGETNGSNITGMPITNDAFQSTTDGSDFYLMVLRSEARDLEYSSYFGGSVSNEHVDGGTSRFDKKGIIYQAVCAGCGGFDDFPTTPGVHSNTNGSSNCNLGVFKFDFQFGEIVARAAVEPDFSGCAPFEIDFRNNTTGATIFRWDFDDGNISTERSPTHVFDEPGIYRVQLRGSIEEDCIDPDSTFVTVEAIEPPPGITATNIICEGDPFSLNSTVTGAGVQYEWSTGDSISLITVDEGGIFWVDSGLETDNCPQRDSFIIEGIPNSNTTNMIGLCEGTERTIASANERPNARFEWNDGSPTQSIEIDEIGVYYVTANEMGCMSIDSFIVTPDSIVLDAVVLDINCIGREFGRIEGSTTGGIPPYEYSFNDSPFSSNSTFEDLEAGTYTLESSDVNGCLDLIELTIDIPPLVDVDLGEIRMICLGDSLELTGNINLDDSEIAQILWSGPNLSDEDCVDCRSQFVRPLRSSIYNLFVRSVDECVDSTMLTVIVDPKRPVFIPSAFSPNNDGINDIFFINALDRVVENVNRFQIYDRWGNLIYEAENFQPNDPTFGWDGFFRQRLMNNAVFAWYAEIEFIDGVVELFEGDVSLLR